MTAGWVCRTVRAALFAVVCVLLAALGHVLMSGTAVPWWTVGGGALAVGGAAWALAGRERGLACVVSLTVTAQAALHVAFSLAQAEGAPGARGRGPFVRHWARYLLCGPDPRPATVRAATRLASRTGLGHRTGSAGMGDRTGTSPTPADAPAHRMTHAATPHAGHTMTAVQGMRHGTGHAMGHMGRTAHAMAHMGHGTSHGMAHMGSGMAAMSPSGMLAAHLLAAVLSGLWLARGERAAFDILRTLACWLAAPLRLPRLRTAPAPAYVVPFPDNHQDLPPRGIDLVHTLTTRGPPAGTAVA